MQTILPFEFKRGMVLMLENLPYAIEDLHTSGTAQTRHKLHTRLRNLKTGRIIDRVFAENERVPVAPLESHRVTYSYARSDTLIFIDAQTFEEFELSKDQLGERHWFVKENEEYKALLLDGRLRDIVFPSQVPLKVIETAPPTRGGSDSRGRRRGSKPVSRSRSPSSSPREKPFELTRPRKDIWVGKEQQHRMTVCHL